MTTRFQFTSSDVRWASYDQWEGPVLRGRCPYVLPAKPTFNDKVLYVTGATEGFLDSVNLYDPGICSVGVIQWIESGGQHNVSQLLGLVRTNAPAALAPLDAIMRAKDVTLARNLAGLWRWRRGTSFLERDDDLRWLYLDGRGRKGTWDEASKATAKAWAAGIANVFADPGAQAVQVAYTLGRLGGFGTEAARRILWDGIGIDHQGVYGAARAAWLMFCINNPRWACNALLAFKPTAQKWSQAWLVELLRHLVFSQKVAHWPQRYDLTRSRLEAVFGIDLPDFAAELEANSAEGMGTTSAIQATLARLGFDPGPLDGRMGAQTKGALIAYQRSRGLEPDGLPGPITRSRLKIDSANASSSA